MVTLLPFLYLADHAMENLVMLELLGLTPVLQAIGPNWLALAGLVWVPFLFAVAGIDVGRIGQASSGYAPSFVLVRPVGPATVAAGKLRLCAAGVCLWSADPRDCSGWVLPAGHWTEMSDRLVALSGSRLAAVLVLVGGLLGPLAAITWGQMAGEVWVGLSGRLLGHLGDDRSKLVGRGAATFLVIGLAINPDYRTVVAEYLPGVMSGAFLLKAVLTLVVFREIVRQGVLTPRTVALVLGAWAVVAAGLFGGLAWLVPAETVTSQPGQGGGAGVAHRPARAGTLALAWNRHR